MRLFCYIKGSDLNKLLKIYFLYYIPARIYRFVMDLYWHYEKCVITSNSHAVYV